MADLIDRQAAIRFIRDKVSLSLFMKRSVDKADKACMELCDMLDRDLPSAQPDRKKGKWILHIDDLFPEESTMECNQCHEHQPVTIDDNFCPNCGAQMVRGES